MRHFAAIGMMVLGLVAVNVHLVLAEGETQVEAQVEEIVIGPFERGQNFQYLVSDKGLRLSSVSMKGSRSIVVVDGVESPKLDEVYATSPKFQVMPDLNGELTQYYPQGIFHTAFSPDGSRYAFSARDGKDVIVIADGKEIFRAPFSPSRAPVALLRFSPDGKHLFFQTSTNDTMYSMALVMDGQQGPPTAKEVFPVFSEDGQHWAYYGTRATPDAKGFVVVDGKEVDWVAGRLRYTKDNKLVGVHVDPQTSRAQLLVDGKELMSADQINRIVIAASGDIAVTATDKNASMLYLNGKPVEGTDGAYIPLLSDDGKHWAAVCSGGNPRLAWVIHDGKRGAEYQEIVQTPVMTADGSKVVYAAGMSGKKFIVAGDEESNGYLYILQTPFAAPAGDGWAAIVDNPQARRAMVSGKVFEGSQRCDGLQFSPDGKRYSFLRSVDLFSAQPVIDGNAIECLVGAAGILFSPDSKHYAAIATPKSERAPFILVDDKFLPQPAGVMETKLIGWTPDSAHLLLLCTRQQKDGSYANEIYSDGRKVADVNIQQMPGIRPNQWEFSPDGKLLVLGTSKDGKSVVRYAITPPADTSLETWAADVQAAKDAAAQAAADKKAADEKAAADAKAAAEKAAADKKAAKEKAAADKKAAAEKAAADKKAAAEKAAADKAAKLKKP